MASSASETLVLSAENIIIAYQNEPTLWNINLNATEEEKELAPLLLLNDFVAQNCACA